jgi:hypothetical protein
MTIAHRGILAALILACLACTGAPRGTQIRKGMPAMAGDLSRIDHVILGINDLQKGIAELERATGVRAVFGGAHPGRGTQNALISLGENHYLEILAPNPEDRASAEARGELQALTSLTPVGWAVRSGDLDALRKTLQSQGVRTGEIRPGARNRPDGSRLAWRTLNFESPSPLLPFFIEWDHNGEHPSATSPGGCRLAGFALQDPAPEAIQKSLRAAGVEIAVRTGERARIEISLACLKGTVNF